MPFGRPIDRRAQVPVSFRGGGAGMGGALTVQVTAVFPNVKNGKEVAQTLTGPSFMAQLTKAFEDFNKTSGIPSQTPIGTLSPGIT
jgi:hypothetical protein